MNRLFPKVIQKFFLLLNFTLSILSGVLFLNSIMQIIVEFLNLHSNIIFYFFLLLIVFSIMNQTTSILFMLEITVLFATPFILFILLRFFTDDQVMIDSIKQSFTFLIQSPKMNAVVSGLFVFTGFTNLLIYSKHIIPITKKPLIVIWGIICLVFYSSYFIPIGYFGLNGVGKENYVWVTAIDSMSIDYFFLERIVIVFIIVLIGITMMYVILSFHSSLKFLQLMIDDFGGKIQWVGIFIVVISAFITQYYTDGINLLKFFSYFFVFRIILDLILLFILLFASRKQIQN